MRLPTWLLRADRTAAASTEVRAAAPAPEAPPEAPRAPSRRPRYRLTGRRSFQAANVGNLTADWTTTVYTADEIMCSQGQKLVARSRDQVFNNPYGRKFAAECVQNVAGPAGMLLRPRPMDLDGTLDRRAAKAIRDTWRAWSKERDCDAAGKLPWPAIQQLVVSTVATDGDIFLQKLAGRSLNPWGYALRLIDPEDVDRTLNKTLANGNQVRLGVEVNAYRRPVAYYVKRPSETVAGGYALSVQKHDRIPADQIIHCFVPWRVGATRGVPWTVTALWRLKQLGAYDDAAIVAARMGASTVYSVEYAEGAGGEFTGEGEDSDGTPIREVEPASIWDLEPGQKVNMLRGDYPRGEYDPFTRSMVRGIAAGLLVCYPTLAQDLAGVTYTSIRHGLLDERDSWKVLQAWLAMDLCDPVYRGWLGVQLLLGTIRIGAGIPGPDREMKFRDVSWQGRRWDWVDPQKEVESDRIAVQERFKSRGQVMRERDAAEPDEVWPEMADEEKELQKLGIPAAKAAADAPPAKAPRKPAPQDEETEA